MTKQAGKTVFSLTCEPHGQCGRSKPLPYSTFCHSERAVRRSEESPVTHLCTEKGDSSPFGVFIKTPTPQNDNDRRGIMTKRAKHNPSVIGDFRLRLKNIR